MLGEIENQFSLTRAASSNCGSAKSDCLSVLTLVSLLGINILVGCATDKESRTESLSNKEFQQLYPRQHYESASPSERQELDRQEQERLRRRNRIKNHPRSVEYLRGREKRFRLVQFSYQLTLER